MMLGRSQLLLIIASLVTLALTWQTYQEDARDGTVLPTRVLASSDSHLPAGDLGSVQQASLALMDRPLVPLTSNLFSIQYVEPKPKPIFKRAAKKRVVSPVVVPPLPFKYIGRWQDKNKQAVMLDYRGEMLVVQEGDIVAGRYRLETVKEAGGRIQLHFLETTSNKRQTMQARVAQP